MDFYLNGKFKMIDHKMVQLNYSAVNHFLEGNIEMRLSVFLTWLWGAVALILFLNCLMLRV